MRPVNCPYFEPAAARGRERCLVQAIKPARLLHLHLLRPAIGANQGTYDHTALLAHALAQGGVGRLGVVQVVGVARR